MLMKPPRTLKRTLAIALAAALLPALPPLGSNHALAAVARVRVLSCRASNPTCWPVGFDFTPGGRWLFYGERLTGQVRVFDRKKRTDRLWKRILGVATDGEEGLLGLAVDPAWPNPRQIFVYATKKSPFRNEVIRIRRRADGTFAVHTILTLAANSFHNGGFIDFGPDGFLYAVTGDAGNKASAQNLSSRSGKILRVRKDGSAAPDNPFGNRVWSYGHRNSIGFAWDPPTGRLWETENAPECNDEINRIRRGRNFGWGPNSSCPNTNSSGPNPVPPARIYNPVIAPTGAAFCKGCGLGSATNGTLLFSAWLDGKIRRLRLSADRLSIVGSAAIYDHPSGILGMHRGPNSWIYFSSPGAIYRLVST
ncbi:MAG TPA: PQQ-dependent sugar dehydrogenase [Actinomycetota bacterium]|nr:PQQ-dependent sugar dehydrogenase [Actinomycetota bacterium]